MFIRNTNTNNPVRILLVSGSLRTGSTNNAVLQTARTVAGAGVQASLYRELAELPHFSPDLDPYPPVEGAPDLPPPVIRLRETLASVDAVFFSIPEYAGSMPGSMKNFLDWCVGGGLAGKPVGWVNASSHGGAKGTHDVLRIVLNFIGSEIVEEACANIGVGHGGVTPEGEVATSDIRDAIAETIGTLAAYVLQKSGG